jgi:hypothetical protein
MDGEEKREGKANPKDERAMMGKEAINGNLRRRRRKTPPVRS